MHAMNEENSHMTNDISKKMALAAIDALEDKKAEDIQIIDDYAHHPGELSATIDAVRTMGYKRIIFAFQPHTYTRTKALFDDFVEQLKRPDIVVLAEIYAARERNTIGISSKDLQAQIPGSHYCKTLPEVTDWLKENVQPRDLVLTVGAGDIYRAGEAFLKE